VKWLRENNCPWDIWTCARAAEAGHLDVLKWARENGCEWDGSTCEKALVTGHTQVYEWAILNGCPFNTNHRDFVQQFENKEVHWPYLQ